MPHRSSLRPARITGPVLCFLVLCGGIAMGDDPTRPDDLAPKPDKHSSPMPCTRR